MDLYDTPEDDSRFEKDRLDTSNEIVEYIKKQFRSRSMENNAKCAPTLQNK